MSPADYQAACARNDRLARRVMQLREQLLAAEAEWRETERQIIEYENQRRAREQETGGTA